MRYISMTITSGFQPLMNPLIVEPPEVTYLVWNWSACRSLEPTKTQTPVVSPGSSPKTLVVTPSRDFVRKLLVWVKYPPSGLFDRLVRQSALFSLLIFVTSLKSLVARLLGV